MLQLRAVVRTDGVVRDIMETRMGSFRNKNGKFNVIVQEMMDHMLKEVERGTTAGFESVLEIRLVEPWTPKEEK